MTPEQMKLVAAAQAYDVGHRPASLLSWTRVPDDQVLRLLLGARLSRETDPAPRPCTVVDQIRWSYGWIREHYGTRAAG
jgi:hypothetical protein